MKSKTDIYYPIIIYPIEIIKQAVFDYKDICKIAIIRESHGTRCCFEHSVEDLSLTAMEFSNYLIELIITQGAK